jgi:Zn-finger nucleic acid-binding protein
MKCAKCDGILVELDAGGLKLDRCESCEGLWFDRRELERLLKVRRDGGAFPPSASTETATAVEDLPGTCPRCEVALERSETIAVPDLFWDTCPSCGGAWLDGGELDRIAADPDAAAEAAFFSRS